MNGVLTKSIGGALILFSCLCAGAPAAAITPGEIAGEVQQIKSECEATPFFSTYHDCACVGRKFGEYRSADGTTVARETLRTRAGDACPAQREAIYDFNYKSCTDYMRDRRTDWEPMCKCSIAKMADAWVAKPVQNMRYIEALKRDSYKACGLGDPSHNIAR